ncbi:hypothetical protein [Spiroplasma kunkelii]|uniref:hypothetical protein n=1 Tax=Spiroplasma kunkelii TaxID=47834 RepID=UPI0006A9E8B1|nr:hypothetical protein [Spiroplasma kunkelii]
MLEHKNTKSGSIFINTPERSFILASCFVFKDKFKEDWFLIGIIPQLSFWARSIKDNVKKESNKKYKGYMLFHGLIDLELYDNEILVAYENNLIKIFDKSIEEKNKNLNVEII